MVQQRMHVPPVVCCSAAVAGAVIPANAIILQHIIAVIPANAVDRLKYRCGWLQFEEKLVLLDETPSEGLSEARLLPANAIPSPV